MSGDSQNGLSQSLGVRCGVITVSRPRSCLSSTTGVGVETELSSQGILPYLDSTATPTGQIGQITQGFPAS